MRECSARALLGRAGVLERLDQLQDALAIYDKAFREFESTPAHDTSAIVSQALLGKGSVLEKLGDANNALLVLDETRDSVRHI